MHKIVKKITILLAMVMLVSTLGGCNTHNYATTEESLIVSADELKNYIGKENVVIVDMQSTEGYTAGHVKGAVNIQNGDITINVPVSTMLTSAKKMESLMGSKFLEINLIENGIKTDKYIIAVDSVGAGIGEVVLVTTGSSARLALRNQFEPVDAVIVGIVD